MLCYICLRYLFLILIINDRLAKFLKLVINHILLYFRFQLRIAYLYRNRGNYRIENNCPSENSFEKFISLVEIPF